MKIVQSTQFLLDLGQSVVFILDLGRSVVRSHSLPVPRISPPPRAPQPFSEKHLVKSKFDGEDYDR